MFASQKLKLSSAAPAAAPLRVVPVSLRTASQVVGVAIASLALTFSAHAGGMGETVFNNNCAACHAGGRNVVSPEKTLDKVYLEKYLAGGFKLDSIVTQVTNGKGAMPAWGEVLDEDEIQAVANWVLEKANAGW
ncbi:hypothetical protein FOA52_009010 [Chlamydomonas sp. UWO 241]|nr:hypothetical protein FOA52_009010 [Chlamydomonas sp. UWO 241]